MTLGTDSLTANIYYYKRQSHYVQITSLRRSGDMYEPENGGIHKSIAEEGS